MAFLTAKRISPTKADLTQPKLIYLEDTQIVMTKVYNGTKGGGATIQYGTGGRPFSKKIKVYETPSQVEVAKNATTINAQDKKLAQTAAGTVQGTALAITNYLTEVTVTNPGTADGVVLPAAVANRVRVVVNNGVGGAGTIKVYPAVGEKIIDNTGTDLGANAAQTLQPGTRSHYACDTTGVWRQALPGQ